MYRGAGTVRDENRNRQPIGRSPPRRRRTPEDENKFCIFCKVQLSSARLFEEHKDSAVHKQKEILIGKALSDGLQYCYTCEKIFPSKLALDAHCLMTRHKPLYRVDELQQELNNKSANINTAPPPPRPPESRRAREEKERQDIVTKLNEVRGGEPIDVLSNDKDKIGVIDNVKTDVENKSFFCEVCNVDCMNHSNFKIHSESWRHRSEVDKRKEEEKQKFDKEAEQHFDAAEELERKKVPAHLTGKAGYFCEVCSIASVSESAYLDHLKNRKHFRQVGQMRRPYKCYFCNAEFNVAKDFNYHLESRSHMDNAFKKDNKGKKHKDDEWVEKKTERKEHREKESCRDSRKDDRGRSRNWHSDKNKHRDRRSKDGEKDLRKTELKDAPPRQADARKVEIVDLDSSVDTGIKDLREKLQAQKNIIITKPNSPEESQNEDNDLPEEDSTKSANLSRLTEVEEEFDAKFESLMKEYENDHVGLQEHLTREREEDIVSYQKYEEDFRELKEEEDFIRGNIDKLEDDDIRKQDFIIDIIRVQRKMEEVRLQLEMKEVTIIKRENSYRKHFPESGEKQDKIIDESNNSNNVYEYNHGTAEKDDVTLNKNGENRVSPEKNIPETSGTDLRIKLERERLLKRLGPELETVDPALREKLLSVILEKDKDNENSKPAKQNDPGDKRQVVKEEDTRMSELTKREKQLELELANLKSTEKKKKKTTLKSLVPQYDDVDDKKKDPKKRSRKRSVSSSSSSRSSSSSSDSSYYKNKKKRKSPASKNRVKTKRSASLEKARRKRRSRSTSRDRDRKKRAIIKKGKEDERKKRVDRPKSDRKRTDRSPMKKPTSKVENRLLVDENDSDVQVITPVTLMQPISVLGSTANALPTKSSTNVIQVSTMEPIQPISTSNIPPRREQFSFWKNPVVVPPVESEPLQESPKEDIWETAFSGGKKEDTTVSSSLNIFDPQGGTQLPEDILNILKSVAPMIQQTQNQSSYKYNSRVPNVSASPANVESANIYTTSSKSRLNNTPGLTKPIEEKKDDRIDSRGIRSILKKVAEPLPPAVDLTKEFNHFNDQPEIPGLDSPAKIKQDPVDQPSGRSDQHTRSILKPPPEFDEAPLKTNTSYYNDSMYSTTDKNGRREHPIHGHPNHNIHHGQDRTYIEEDSLGNHQPSHTLDPLRKPYEREPPYENRTIDPEDKEISSYNNASGYRQLSHGPPVDPHDPYSITDTYRPPPVDRELDRVISPREDNISPGGTELRPKIVNPYDTRSLREERDPYLRSEVTHRVIDYSYVRDTHVIPGEPAPPPTSRYHDEKLKQPVRYPGETDDEYYARFERFYEMNRRHEEKRERETGPNRRSADSGRLPPHEARVPPHEARVPPHEARVPPHDDYYPTKDRYDERSPRPPINDSFRSRGPTAHDRGPPLGGRIIDESLRRVERNAYPDQGREARPYEHIVKITKRVEDKSVVENADRPMRWSETIESRYTSDPIRSTRNDIPRDFDARVTLPRLPPPRLQQPPCGPIGGGPRALLPRPTAPINSDFDKFQDY